MKSINNAVAARNLLIGAGAYYLSGWVGMPLAMGFGKLTQGLVYAGTFNGYFVLPLVSNLPWAIVAAAAGAVVVLLVESDHPIRWVFLPAILYAFLGFFGYHWARQPLPLDRVAQAIGAFFPASACIVGALAANQQRASFRF